MVWHSTQRKAYTMRYVRTNALRNVARTTAYLVLFIDKNYSNSINYLRDQFALIIFIILIITEFHCYHYCHSCYYQYYHYYYYCYYYYYYYYCYYYSCYSGILIIKITTIPHIEFSIIITITISNTIITVILTVIILITIPSS